VFCNNKLCQTFHVLTFFFTCNSTNRPRFSFFLGDRTKCLLQPFRILRITIIRQSNSSKYTGSYINIKTYMIRIFFIKIIKTLIGILFFRYFRKSIEGLQSNIFFSIKSKKELITFYGYIISYFSTQQLQRIKSNLQYISQYIAVFLFIFFYL
jgi:hypothetical protein